MSGMSAVNNNRQTAGAALGELGEVEVERVDPLEDLLGLVHALPPLLRQVAQTVPLVADVLATLVDDGAV